MGYIESKKMLDSIISYSRAKDLLINTINYALRDRETDIALEDLYDIGFEDEEISELGFSDVFFNEEDENE